MTAILGQLILGWLLADLVTGVFHWWEDTHPHLVDVPFIGSFIIAPNILHHQDPQGFLQHTFWHRNGASMVAAAVLGGLLMWPLGPSVWLAALVLGTGLSNEAHAWAHSPSRAPPVVRLFQQTGILQSPKGHAAHHRPPHETRYCVLTDWLNPFLDAGNVWRRR